MAMITHLQKIWFIKDKPKGMLWYIAVTFTKDMKLEKSKLSGKQYQ